jgi:hypothetical protein
MLLPRVPLLVFFFFSPQRDRIWLFEIPVMAEVNYYISLPE